MGRAYSRHEKEEESIQRFGGSARRKETIKKNYEGMVELSLCLTN
jgi:hypothetical protein